MLGKLELKLRCAEEINYQMASLFHGVLMELIPSEYADYLHLSQLHPYSQHLEYRDETWYWIICGLNKEAVQTIIVDSVWNMLLDPVIDYSISRQVKEKYKNRYYSKKIYRNILSGINGSFL